MKRTFDAILSFTALLLFSPVLLFFVIRIWLEDRHSPFYVAPRVGMNGRIFKLIKFRSMVVDADKSCVDSTSADDLRITGIGNFIRRYKIDELPNFINILRGDMSFVGPRPNVPREVKLYSHIEKRLLKIRPGVTDFASIVFADEGEILKDHPDPDIGYNQLIRPWKSRLGLFYVDNAGFLMDMQLIFLTALNMIHRESALSAIHRILKSHNVNDDLQETVLRDKDLFPVPPPGFNDVVRSR
jgi:lipopolysaccharide/colanic/teichoic acid biosynthesis glycosyltransferase